MTSKHLSIFLAFVFVLAFAFAPSAKQASAEVPAETATPTVVASPTVPAKPAVVKKVVKKKKKKYHWNSSAASTYGGTSEEQGVAGPYPRTGWLERNDVMYFAHKTMKFGTKVRFKYKSHGKWREVTAKCVDRGPYCGNREFDLGLGRSGHPNVAGKLHFNGTGTVKWRVIKPAKKHKKHKK